MSPAKAQQDKAVEAKNDFDLDGGLLLSDLGTDQVDLEAVIGDEDFASFTLEEVGFDLP